MVWQLLSLPYDGNSHTWKDGLLYWDGAQLLIPEDTDNIKSYWSGSQCSGIKHVAGKLSTDPVLTKMYKQECMKSGGRLNIKMPSYKYTDSTVASIHREFDKYRDTHVKDKMVSPTVLSSTWESPSLGKTVFILRRGPGRFGVIGVH